KEALKLDEMDISYNIDCRNLDDTPDLNEDGTNEDEIEKLRLQDPLDVCKRGKTYPLEWETWIDEGAWRVVGEDLAPWRGEAIMTSEGDFQVTFHHRMPGKADMRFAFAIDPVFQPEQCVESDDGDSTELVPIDGNWLDGWTGDLTDLAEEDEIHPGLSNFEDDLDNSTLYYLNARSYQFDPENTEEYWSVPLTWRAGFASGKFAEEYFHARTVRYGEPPIYASFEAEDGGDPEEEQIFYCGAQDTCEKECKAVNRIADDIADELTWAGPNGDQDDAETWFRPMVHCNTWRDTDLEGPLEAGEPDGRPPGLDGWVGLHYNWVILDDSSTLEVGGSASGAFGMVFDGDESRSKFFISGHFNVDRIKADRWTTDDIKSIKLAQNGTTLCE
ncbi:MAG: hypothetical protein HN348_25265, partial [Proteobacteria bacterium]|nr:hypothetical protein [Pseudomonadota bacterium]